VSSVLLPIPVLTYGRLSPSTHGPLIHERSVEKVTKHVNDAVQKGAQILVGGCRIDRPGTFFAPTVLCDVPSNALINDEETFGPIAALAKFETEEEVIKLANNSDVGLAGYFYSRDVGRVWRMAEALEVGMVGSNTGLISHAAIPFGGIKESGIGEFFPVAEWIRSERIQVGRAVMELRNT
jgi:succinate-semialdehyde dehydrogenase / glutarate-semialdehyde dehydrogenase